MASPNTEPRNRLFDLDRRDFRSRLLESESKAIRQRTQQDRLRSCTDIYAREVNIEEACVPETFIIPFDPNLRNAQVSQEACNVESSSSPFHNHASSSNWPDWVQSPALSPYTTNWEIKDTGARPELGQSNKTPSEPLGDFCATCHHPLDFFGLCQSCLHAALDFNEEPGGGIC